jgi:hypothetical protein
MKWFKHDTNAHTDAKLEKVLMRYGADGYALYWYCIELIAGKLDSKNFTFELEHDSELLGYKLKIDSIRIEEIMKYMINIGLFECTNEVITCMKIARRLDSSMSGNAEMRKLIANSHDRVMMQSGQSHDSVIAEQNRTEQNRSNRAKTKKRFSPPTLTELDEYITEKGYNVSGQKFINFYESKGWMVGKNKMKSWKHAVANWHDPDKPSNANPWDGAK